MAARLSLQQTLPYLLISAGVLGLIASFALTYDTLQVMQNPSFVPACNINPILSCGSVMKSVQASTFGFPNSIFGIGAFSALLTFGLLLASGVIVKRWVWLAVQFVATLGVVCMHYLFFQSVFVLHTICPWCFGVWMITIPTFWYITLHTLSTSKLAVTSKLKPFILFLQHNHAVILALWYLAIFVTLGQQFWQYWSTLL